MLVLSRAKLISLIDGEEEDVVIFTIAEEIEEQIDCPLPHLVVVLLFSQLVLLLLDFSFLFFLLLGVETGQFAGR